MTAAELALGVLDGDVRAQALRRVLADPTFAREVADWRAWLNGLLFEVAPVDPGPAVEGRILAQPAAEATGSLTMPRRSDALPWKMTTGLSTAAAALLLGVLLWRPPEPIQALPAHPAASPLVAVIAPQDGEPFSAVYDPASHEVKLLGTVPVPSGRDAELWAIGADGVPRALGLLPQSTTRRLKIQHVEVLSGTVLAISIEPAGGSPRSIPTGPVVATGKLVTT